MDHLDILALLGAGLLAWGLWTIWPPLAPTVIGALLLGLALYLTWEATHGHPNKPNENREPGER